MRRGAKVVAKVLIVVVAVPLLFAGAMYANAWLVRWRAGRLLAVLKTMTPGVTTEADYLSGVKSWQDLREQQDVAYPGHVEVSNYPGWLFCSDQRQAVCGSAMSLMPVGTFFNVIPIFTDGKLAYLGIREGQEPMSYRCCALVQMYSKSYENSDTKLPRPFEGYVVLTDGPHIGLSLIDVQLDERATPAERDRAWDFSFRCFTTYRTCHSSELFLKPAPNR